MLPTCNDNSEIFNTPKAKLLRIVKSCDIYRFGQMGELQSQLNVVANLMGHPVLIRDTTSNVPMQTVLPPTADITCLVSGQKLPRITTGAHAVASGRPSAPTAVSALWVEVEYFDEQRFHLPGVERDQHLNQSSFINYLE